MKEKIKRILKYKHLQIITASLALVLLCIISYSYGSRPAKRRNLTNTPLLWAKLDGTLTDENSSGSTFAYSPGKPATETGVSIKEGDNIQYSPGSTIDAGSSVYENWNPNQGTMNVWVQPNWAGNDNTRHDIWNGDLGRIDTTDSNLKAYFKFDEGSEDFAFDGTANGNVGYLHGPALSFDGGDYVNCGTVLGLNGDFSGSISAWIRRTSGTTFQAVVVAGTAASLQSFSLSINGNGDGSFSAEFNGGNGRASAGGLISLNTWVHLTVVKTPGAIESTTKLYLNGNEVAQAAGQTGTPNFVVDKCYIGTWTNLSPYFSGQINNVRIYNRALSATEVAQHYAGNFSGGNSGLVGYWPMDENQGQTVADKSGNNNNGTRGADANSGSDDPTWVNYAPGWTDEGRFGKAITLDGSDDEIEFGDINF